VCLDDVGDDFEKRRRNLINAEPGVVFPSVARPTKKKGFLNVPREALACDTVPLPRLLHVEKPEIIDLLSGGILVDTGGVEGNHARLVIKQRVSTPPHHIHLHQE